MANEHEQPTVRRIPTSGIHVAVKIDATSEHTFWSDLTMDLATSGGVFVATFHPLAMGTIVHMLVTVAGDDVPFAASGVVRWTRPHRDGSDGVAGVGVAFLDLDASAHEKVARFVDEHRAPMIFELDETPMRKRSR